MRIHTDNLAYRDICAALPRGVTAYVTDKGSRKRDHAFEVALYVYAKDDLHRRYGTSGGYGNSNDVAATWDEWGVWLAKLYEMEPNIVTGYYKDEDEFYSETRRHRDSVQSWNKPTSLAWRTHLAPWLD